jgi:DNA-binding GntR family transcriptional regulator
VTDLVYDTLRELILSGSFAAGRQLNLNQLEAELDVSRTPLKSALTRLQVEGLVEVHPRRGTFVMRYEGRDIEECYELRIALEAQALRYAYEPRNRELVQQIIILIEEMEDLLTSEDDWLQTLPAFMDRDRVMHLNIVAMSQNERMIRTYESANVQGFIAIMGSKFDFSDTQKTKEEHRAFRKALISGHLPALLDAARSHLDGAKQRALLRLGDG